MSRKRGLRSEEEKVLWCRQRPVRITLRKQMSLPSAKKLRGRSCKKTNEPSFGIYTRFEFNFNLMTRTNEN